MTIYAFEQRLKKINPKFRIRVRGYKDVAGLFVGLHGRSGYITRMTKGELQLNGYRKRFHNVANPTEWKMGNIEKRGRKHVVNTLRKFGWITKPQQVSMLMWGVEYPDEEVRGDNKYPSYFFR